MKCRVNIVFDDIALQDCRIYYPNEVKLSSFDILSQQQHQPPN